jgi:acyl carrier protein
MLMVPQEPGPAGVLAAKVDGTVALFEAVASHRPDFIVLCSSFAAVSGGLGQGEYAAGNAFVDAAAWTARALGLRATAVNWPAWREVGMACAIELPPELEHLRRASLESGITPAEGVELFSRIVACDLPQVVVAPFATAATPTAAAASVGTSNPSKPVASPQRVTAQGRVQVEARSQASDSGTESLMALQIVSRVSEQFGVEMNLTEIFDNPTLAGFSAFVHRRMVERIAEIPDDRVHDILAAG